MTLDATFTCWIPPSAHHQGEISVVSFLYIRLPLNTKSKLQGERKASVSKVLNKIKLGGSRILTKHPSLVNSG